jgi:hypothetical protein
MKFITSHKNQAFQLVDPLCQELAQHATTAPLNHNTIPALISLAVVTGLTTRDDGTTAGAPKSKCAQLGCRVGGQAADDDNIRDRHSGDRQWHAAR